MKRKRPRRESEKGRDDMSTSKTRTQATSAQLSRESPAPALQAPADGNFNLLWVVATGPRAEALSPYSQILAPTHILCTPPKVFRFNYKVKLYMRFFFLAVREPTAKRTPTCSRGYGTHPLLWIYGKGTFFLPFAALYTQ
jgi:hypothetical protein